MNLYLIFREVFKYLVPTWIRGERFVSWVGSLLEPLQSLNIVFSAFGSAMRYDLAFNGQVVYLEHVLNDKFDLLRRIYIDDPAGQQVFTPYVFNKVEAQPPLYIYNAADALPADENVVIYNTAELVTTEDFVVHVPADVFSPGVEVQMRKLINIYRIAPKRYSFSTF